MSAIEAKARAMECDARSCEAMALCYDPDGEERKRLPDWESPEQEQAERSHNLGVEQERAICVSFLRRAAKDHRKHASALLADTQQSKPDADWWDAMASALDAAADTIEAGRYWR